MPSSAKLISFIARLGYQPWQYEGGKFVRHQIAEWDSFDNLIFVPTGSSLDNSLGGSVPQASGWPSVLA